MTQEPDTIAFEIVPADSGLELTAKHSLELAFSGFFTEAEKWKQHAATITEPRLARTARLELKNIRVAAEKKRKELKEDSLRMGKAIDGANNILLAIIVPIEQHLDDIEKAEDRRIAAEIAALQDDRSEQLAALEFSPIPANLGNLTADQWNEHLQNATDLLAIRKERERKAEEERLAAIKKEAEEREAQRLENIRLKEEAEKQAAAAKAEREERERIEAAAAKEREAAEKKRIEAERKAADERAAIEAKAKAERDAAEEVARKEREASAAALRKEQEARQKLEREQRDKEAAETKAKAEQAAKAKADALAPDKEKLVAFAASVRALPFPKLAKADGADILAKRESFAKWIETQAANL